MPKCKSCKAEIVWYQTVTGASMPVDALPSADGNVDISSGLAVVMAGANLEATRLAGVPLYLSHHASCPQADQFRKPKPKGLFD